jgi:DNA-binding MarR family transcriptional regulator
MYIWRLARFMRADFKRHFSGSPLQNVDEFLLLGGAHHLAAPTKTQLFEYGLLETTTGLQMLARLVRDGLVTETADATDRRLKRITLTAAGQAELGEAVRRLHAVDDDLFHLLSPTDLAYIECVLERLNAYHTARSTT